MILIQLVFLIFNLIQFFKAGIYGMAAQIPDKTLIDEVAFMYLDSCYSMPKKIETGATN